MIIEIKIANYRSINEEQTLSFVADRATRHPDNLIKRPSYRLLKAVGMFGANASGKSNFVKAIRTMSLFVRDSATKMNYDDPIEAAEPYRLDPATRDRPSRFEITFVTDGTAYIYGFAATPERVHEEWLSAKAETSEKEMFHFKRTWDSESERDVWLISPQLKPLTEMFRERTRPNGLALSLAARENYRQLVPVYRYLRENIQVHNMANLNRMLVLQTATWCQDDEHLGQKIAALLRDSDTGIEGLSIQAKQSEDSANEAVRLLRAGNNSNIDTSWRSILFPDPQITTFHRDTTGKTISFDFIKTASNGTQRLFALSGIMLVALQEGSFIVLDEIDASMHPLLTRKLLELFQSPEANPNGAQLLFTTHDAVMLDSVLFRRDQIVLAEKCDNESQFYSLAEVVPPPRNTEMFLRSYLTGRYGGTPHIGPAFDMLTVGSKT